MQQFVINFLPVLLTDILKQITAIVKNFTFLVEFFYVFYALVTSRKFQYILDSNYHLLPPTVNLLRITISENQIDVGLRNLVNIRNLLLSVLKNF